MKRTVPIVVLVEGSALPDDATILKVLQGILDAAAPTAPYDAVQLMTRPIDPTEPPALDIDGRLYDGRKMSARAKSERRVVWNLFAHLAAAGWEVTELNDGDGWKPVIGAKPAMELIFNLDDCWVQVTKGGRSHWLRFVLGNSPEEVLSDYSYSETSGFAAVVEAFKAEDYV
jgi:hypothetical protein